MGLIFKYQERLYFIHSNYLGSRCVTVEPAKNSEAFFSYGIYIAAITTNKSLIKSWILNNEIKIVDERILNEELYISKETVETNLDTVHH